MCFNGIAVGGAESRGCGGEIPIKLVGIQTEVVNENVQDDEAVFDYLARRPQEPGVGSAVAHIAQAFLLLLIEWKPTHHDGDPREHLGKVNGLHPLPTKIRIHGDLHRERWILQQFGREHEKRVGLPERGLAKKFHSHRTCNSGSMISLVVDGGQGILSPG